MAALSTESAPWYIAYPEPRTPNPPIDSRAELLKWLQEGQLPGADFILVDLRRNDHEVSDRNLLLQFLSFSRFQE